ncbi:MAG: carbohydrate kinase family protein [Anaerolineae bacterium]
MNVYVCGSIAFDYLMHFPGLFREHILADNLDRLSVSFLADSMRRAYGGVAANIAYSLGLLGEKPYLVGAVGADFGDYRTWLAGAGVDTRHVKVVPDKFTSSFFVSTDDANSQIATFYIGAMAHADEIALPEVGVVGGDFVVVSPDKPEAMVMHCRQAKQIGARLLFDPSQQIPRLSGEQLTEAIHGAYALAVNEYEFAMLREKTGLDEARVRAAVDVLIVTKGEQGSQVFEGDRCLTVPSMPPTRVVDPTGVGDAYRAGFIKGLIAGLDLDTCGRMGSTAACFVLEQVGTQEHRFTHDDFVARFRQAFCGGNPLDGEAASVAAALA